MEKGMSKEELEKKIENSLLKDQYFSERVPIRGRMVTRSEKILKREGLLHEETRKNLYELLGDLYVEHRDYNFAALKYKQAGLEDKSKEMWIKYAEKNRYKAEIEHWHELFSEAARGYENAGLIDEAKEMWEKYGKDQEDTFRFRRAGNAYEKAGLEDKAKDMFRIAAHGSLEQRDYNESIKLFQKSGLDYNEIHEIIMPVVKEQNQNYPYMKLFEKLGKIYNQLGLEDKAQELQNICK